MKRFGRTMGLLAALGAALVMTLVIPAFSPSAQATPVPMGGSASTQWAYGAEKWMNVSASLPNGSVSIHAFFGWHVVLTATNTSATTVAFEAQRTVGASLFVTLCAPNCGSPTATGNVSFRAWEQDTGFSNFTTAATVYENGTPTPALGIVNASARSAGAVNESLKYTLSTPTLTGTATASLAVKGHAHASVAFAPALGLVPWNAAPNTTWNSSSAFNAQGSWSASWMAARTTFTGATFNASGAPSASVQGTGTVSLAGQDLGTVTLNNGQTVPAIALVLTGPFDESEGIILIPHAFDLFSGGAHEWDSHGLGIASASTARVDLALDSVHHHVQLEASASTFGSSNMALGSAAVVAGSQPAAATPGGLVQAQPETVPQAQQASTCLAGACSGPSGSSAVAGSLLPLLVIGLVIGLVVGTVSVVEWRVWSRRRADKGLAGSYGQVPTSGLPPPGAALPQRPGFPSPPASSGGPDSLGPSPPAR